MSAKETQAAVEACRDLLVRLKVLVDDAEVGCWQQKPRYELERLARLRAALENAIDHETSLFTSS